ncbi:hypothetical protein CDCA_CDCA16G4284 [Cyanidium caldarium]|uniref:RCK N-terminal domain-containing protein n=1 Tax=Cyanidium caldarium TaxID=2771 RepID=A0AAV9J175_CYACA|nr:hypothetical protein CDCA_CDCA16G4284 [Cyanidium caldarium]
MRGCSGVGFVAVAAGGGGRSRRLSAGGRAGVNRALRPNGSLGWSSSPSARSVQCDRGRCASGAAGCPVTLRWACGGRSAFLGGVPRAASIHLRRPARRRKAPCGTSVTRFRWRASFDDPGAAFALRDALALLAATVVTIPIFKKMRLSPILGFLLAGVVLGPHGLRLVRDVEDITTLADLGVLFLLFQMGLELSLERLWKLRKLVFGYGTLQMGLTTVVLGLGAYFVGGRAVTWQEATVIGGALSLSSSAFVLRLLQERDEQNTRVGLATFGVLLFQDLAVVPLLVLLPLLADISAAAAHATGTAGIMQEVVQLSEQLGWTLLKALGALAGIAFVGGTLLRFVFDLVNEAKSSEAFTAMVLLTVLGTAFVTDRLGLSMTLGAFISGVLLSESSYRSEISVDVEPFRGMLLGLFFITTGMSADLSVVSEQPALVLGLIATLIGTKALIATAVGRPFMASWPEAARVGLLLGQGGEFAFVAFALAKRLGFLPESVNTLLIDVVVASMALTPALAALGATLFRVPPTASAAVKAVAAAAAAADASTSMGGKGAAIDATTATATNPAAGNGTLSTSATTPAPAPPPPEAMPPATTTRYHNGEWTATESERAPLAPEPPPSATAIADLERLVIGGSLHNDLVVICGFGLVGRVIARMLSAKLIPFVAVDRDPVVAQYATAAGLPCLCGDATDLCTFLDAGIDSPTAFVITLNVDQEGNAQVQRRMIDTLRHEFTDRPIFARARTLPEQRELRSLGVTATYPEHFESSLQLGRELMRGLSIRDAEVEAMVREMHRNEELGKLFREWETQRRKGGDGEERDNGAPATRGERDASAPQRPQQGEQAGSSRSTE